MADKIQVNMHDAKSQLSKLVEKAETGEEVVIARNGKPVAKLVPIEKRFPVAPPGFLKGELEILPGFYEMDAEIEREFEEAIEKPILGMEPESEDTDRSEE